MTHWHLTAFALTGILFMITVVLQGQGKDTKIWKMVLRTSYLLVMLTGGLLLLDVYKFTFLHILKVLVSIVMFGIFEMIISWRDKGKSVNLMWIVFAIVLITLVYMGLKLPMGLYLF